MHICLRLMRTSPARLTCIPQRSFSSGVFISFITVCAGRRLLPRPHRGTVSLAEVHLRKRPLRPESLRAAITHDTPSYSPSWEIIDLHVTQNLQNRLEHFHLRFKDRFSTRLQLQALKMIHADSIFPPFCTPALNTMIKFADLWESQSPPPQTPHYHQWVAISNLILPQRKISLEDDDFCHHDRDKALRNISLLEDHT